METKARKHGSSIVVVVVLWEFTRQTLLTNGQTVALFNQYPSHLQSIRCLEMRYSNALRRTKGKGA